MSNRAKYESQNPIQRLLVNRFLERAAALAAHAAPARVLDAGCGEGFMSRALARSLPGEVLPFGLELVREALLAGAELSPASQRGRTLQGSLVALPFKDRAFDLVVATEVLEHLDQPEAALAELTRVARRHLLLSVPWEPWFCMMNLARAKNVRRLGSDPDHRQHWTRGGFLRMIARAGRVVAAPVDVLPWTLVLVERPPT